MRTIKNPLSPSSRWEAISTVLRALAGQEGCDGEPYDQMMEAAEELDRLDAEVRLLDRWADHRSTCGVYRNLGCTCGLAALRRQQAAIRRGEERP